VKAWLKLLIGVVLLPAAFCSLLAAARTMGGLLSEARLTHPFLAGFLGYPVVHYLCWRPLTLYVFGHELSHAIFAWASGAKVLGFSVSEEGGHVDLSHSNFVVALAPYVVPIYALAVIAGYRVLLWYARWRLPPPIAHGVFLGAMGAALAFHLVHTAEVLGGQRQPDLEQAGGLVFSLSLIGLGNGAVLIVALKCLFPELVSVADEISMVRELTGRFWTLLAVGFATAFRSIVRAMA